MGDPFGECMVGLCGFCCICCSSGLQQWSFFQRWGSGSSSASSGCCTSCCKRSFDDDEFEREETKLREQRLAREAAQAQADGGGDSDERVGSNHAANGDDVVSTQPKGTQMMSDKLSPDKEQQQGEVTPKDGT